ncbi:mechanosensitive ion channel protein MscS [Achromobacter piechaudii]|uniref:mechanosensitive ion channel family protein n=1 Tax=Achromobacter piechaudii TaxID=72556 RepID=UPI00068068BC|nr:mechanosensitive ion channel domain-containing protein [Achromobacter piechaudii]KNY11664.1 mechanosensitive ion channel protein MscS [Achromobacter piechaudii]
MRIRASVHQYLFGLALALLALLAFGLPQPAAADPPPTSSPAASIPIQMADIPLRADSDTRYAEAVLQRAAVADPDAVFGPALEAIAKSTDEKLYEFQPVQLRTLPIMRVESLERHWVFDANRLARWQADLRQATAWYASDTAELLRRRAAWQAIKDSPAAAVLPPALADRVDGVLAQLEAAAQSLSGPLSRQADLEQRANAIEERIRAGERAVTDAIVDIDARLMRIDSPPLWDLGKTQDAGEDTMALLRTGLEIELRFARDYAAAGSGNQRALHVLQLVLLPLLLWLARKSRDAIRAGVMSETAAGVLGRPWSTWLLLSMLGVLALEPDAPLMVQQVALVLAAVPVLRLLPPSARRQMDQWPRVITALFLAERLGFLFLANTLFYRLSTVALTALALAAILWLLHRTRLQVHPPASARLATVLRGIAWGAASLLCVSLAANVFGNVSLAEMLTSAVIGCGYFGLVLYAGVTVIITLLQLLLTRQGISRFRLAREHAPPLVQLLIRLLTASAAVGWAVYAMDRFRILRATYAFVTEVLSYTLTVGEISISLGNVLLFLISVVIAFWAARTIRLILHDEVLTRMELPRGVGNSIASLTYYLVLLLGLGIALSAAGFQTSQLTIVFGALGVGIGFGLQGVVNNFVSGLILMFERPIQPGDVVEISGTSGQVRDIGMRATRIKTFEGADVIVPNGTLLSEKLTNWTLLDRSRRIEAPIGLAYGTEPAQAIALLDRVARDTPGVVADPAPAVLFMGFGASTLEFSVRAWTYDFDRWIDIRSDLLTRMYDALRLAGIEIAFPQQDLHLRTVSEEVGAVLGGGRRPASGAATSEPPAR